MTLSKAHTPGLTERYTKGQNMKTPCKKFYFFLPSPVLSLFE